MRCSDDFELVALPDGKVIAWGGAHDGRHYNDSFVLECKQWRHVTAPSRLPRDFKNIKDQNFVDFASVWDPKIGAPVRFGLAEVAIWMSERWQLHVVPRYDELLGGRMYGSTSRRSMRRPARSCW